MRPLALAFLLAAAPLAAQEVDLLKGSAVAPAPTALPRAADGSFVLGPEACAAVLRLSPAGGDYRPGVDAVGGSVAPADLPTASRPRLETFPVEITAPVQGAAAGTQPLLRLGYVTVQGTRAFFNGEPLTDPEQERLVAACRTRPQ